MKNKYSLCNLPLPILLWSASSGHALTEPISLNKSSSFNCSPVVTEPPVTREKCRYYLVDRPSVLSGPARIRVTACLIETPDPEDKTYVIYTSSPNWLTWLCQDNNKGRESSQQTEVEALTITIVDKQTSDPDGEIPAVAGGGHDDDLFDDRRPRKPGMPPGIIPVLLETVSAGWLPVRLMSFAFDLELPGLSDNSPIFFQQGILPDDSDILVVASGNRQKIYRRVYQLGSWYLAGQTDSNALPPIEEPFDDFIAEDQSVRILVGVFGWAGKDSIPIYQMPVGQGQDNGASGIGQSAGGSEMSGSTSTGARDITSYPQQDQGNGDGNGKRNRPPNEKEPGKVNVGYYDCPICLQEIKDAVQISCGHSFCNQCIQELKRHQETPQCPECKKIISGEGTPNYALRRLERDRHPNKRVCKEYRTSGVSHQTTTPTNLIGVPEATRAVFLADSTVPSTFHALSRSAGISRLRCTQWISNLLWMLTKLVEEGLLQRDQGDLAIQTVTALLPQVVPRPGSFRPGHVSNLLQLLAKLVEDRLIKLNQGGLSRQVVMALLPQVQIYQNDFTSREVSNLLCALAKLVEKDLLQLYQGGLAIQTITALLPQVQNHPNNFTSQEVSNLLWTLAQLVKKGLLQLDQGGLTRQAVTALLPQVQNYQDNFTSQQASNLLWALVQLVEKGLLQLDQGSLASQAVMALLPYMQDRQRYFNSQVLPNLRRSLVELLENERFQLDPDDLATLQAEIALLP